MNTCLAWRGGECSSFHPWSEKKGAKGVRNSHCTRGSRPPRAIGRRQPLAFPSDCHAIDESAEMLCIPYPIEGSPVVRTAIT